MGVRYIAILLFLHGISHCKGQYLITNNSVPITDCSSGLKANEDRLIFMGTIFGVDITSWKSYVDFVIMNKNSGAFLKVVCYVNLATCITAGRTSNCYCTFVSDKVYAVVLNITATEELNDTVIKLVWPRLDYKEIVSSKPWNVPHIYSESAAVTSLQVNSEYVNLLIKNCKFTAPLSPILMQYCCSGIPSPCLAKIISPGLTVAGTPCAVANVTVSPRKTFTFTHSVCGKESPRIFTCTGVRATIAGRSSDDVPVVSGYRNAAIFLASTIAIGLIIATVHRLDASLLFTPLSGRKQDGVNIIRKL